MPQEKNCIECDKYLIGRGDKKFCSDLCRSRYNNKVDKEAKMLIKNVNYILRRNRRLLKALNIEGATKVGKELLMTKGFNFEYYTNTYKTKSNQVYYYCYDHGYLELNDDRILLVTRNN